MKPGLQICSPSERNRMSEHIKTKEELEIDQLAACNVGGRIRAAIFKIANQEPRSATLILEELLCFIEQRDLPDESPIGGGE